MTKQIRQTEDPEIIAIGEVYAALKDLDADARFRVLNYVSGKFNISKPVITSVFEKDDPPVTRIEPHYEEQTKADDEFDGVSPAGKKWITRSGISQLKLMSIFSLGIDEIDLVSKSVPGAKKAQRLKNVFLLKGLAAYLSTGAARFTHEQIKETCLHYDAWDGPNFSTIFKSMAADVSGGKDGGYNLTAKGISEATSLVKSMTGSE